MVVGSEDGVVEGTGEGTPVGYGEIVGALVGRLVGKLVGLDDGGNDGPGVGRELGTPVGAELIVGSLDGLRTSTKKSKANVSSERSPVYRIVVMVTFHHPSRRRSRPCVFHGALFSVFVYVYPPGPVIDQ